jgi:DNA polymerase III epsilon subunit-like protein
MLASDATITVLDFEGTGAVKGFPDEPWQIGLVQLVNGKLEPDTQFESLLRVGDRPFNRYAPGRHAQLREEMKAAPDLQALWPQLRDKVEGPPLVAHNAATENRYLMQAFPLHPPRQWIDTLKLVRIAYPKLRSHKLEDLIARMQLTNRLQAFAPGRTSHDALYDAIACALLLEKLLQLPGWETTTIDALHRAHPRKFHGRPPR